MNKKIKKLFVDIVTKPEKPVIKEGKILKNKVSKFSDQSIRDKKNGDK